MVYSAKDSMDVEGKVAIVTGGNAGVGYAVAKALLEKKAHVIIASSSAEKGEKAVGELKKLVPSSNVDFMKVDLSSPDSIRSFVNAFIERGLPLHILVNNAGVAGIAYSKTVEGHEITHATNHLGTFLLTNLLLDILKKSAPARVITTSSHLGDTAKVDLDDVGGDKVTNSEMAVYGTTKAYNIMFAQELEQRLKGTGVTSYVVQPGVAKTEMIGKAENSGQIRFFKAFTFMFQSPEKVAISAVHAATSSQVENIGASKMIGPNWLNMGNSTARQIKNSNISPKNNALLWDRTAAIVGI